MSVTSILSRSERIRVEGEALNSLAPRLGSLKCERREHLGLARRGQRDER
jgi:hypothetical protein